MIVVLQGHGGPGMNTNIGGQFILNLPLDVLLFLTLLQEFCLAHLCERLDTRKQSFIHIYCFATDTQKQVGAQAPRPGSNLHHPIGLPVAIAAANVMAGALGGAQIATKQTQIGLENQPGFGSDPLTMHLSKMSRNQLIDIISELKVSVQVKLK